MADIILFHHVQGLTPGVAAFADRLAESGHTVHTPDLFSGHVFAKLDEGFTFMKSLDPDDVRQRVENAVAELPGALVYAGISWGVTHAQRLAQTRPGARGALFLEACFPITGEWAFGPWPYPYRFTAWIATNFSPSRVILRPPESSPLPQPPAQKCSHIRETPTSSSTARSPRMTSTRRASFWSVSRVSSPSFSV